MSTISQAVLQEKPAELIYALLQAKADPDLPCGCHWGTTLLCAADIDNPEAARLLVAAGADINVVAERCGNKNAFELATEKGHKNVCNVIIAEVAERDRIRNEIALEHSLANPIKNYLVDGPLSIKPLTHIFAEYAARPDLISNTDVLARRVATTRMSSKLHDQEHKED